MIVSFSAISISEKISYRNDVKFLVFKFFELNELKSLQQNLPFDDLAPLTTQVLTVLHCKWERNVAFFARYIHENSFPFIDAAEVRQVLCGFSHCCPHPGTSKI